MDNSNKDEEHASTDDCTAGVSSEPTLDSVSEELSALEIKRRARNKKKHARKKAKKKELVVSEKQLEDLAAAEGLKAKEVVEGEDRERLLKAVGKEAVSGRTIVDSTTKYKFWQTQPVPGLGVKVPKEFNHPIDPDKKPNEVPKEPEPLLDGYEWDETNVDDPVVMEEIYTLLNENYVEDDDNMFRFDYSKEFLHWALKPPGFFRDWHIGVRISAPPRQLVGFITGIPVSIRIYDRVVRLAEINFLCVHKSLRTKRLAPVLIKEITRRVHLRGMFQAVYTAGIVLPNPICICKYYHRSLNPKKLIEVGFSSLGQRMTMSRTIKLYRLPETPSTPGLRPMERSDVKEVHRLLTKFLEKFQIHCIFSEQEVAHWFLPQPDVISSFVVEDPMTHKLTGLLSHYTLPSTIIGSKKYQTLKAAYAYYNINENGPITPLMKDSLILARNEGFDVFNCLDIQDNEDFIGELKFGIGDGRLHYYVYNWACPELLPNQTGLVLL